MLPGEVVTNDCGTVMTTGLQSVSVLGDLCGVCSAVLKGDGNVGVVCLSVIERFARLMLYSLR